ncbi:MAG: hypothetical protein PHS14_00405 [Elusimicrobia bacterium]|nr:hypothetical protein [Elusimicrobiota bacterium]
MSAQRVALLDHIRTALVPSGGYVDLDPLAVDLPGQPGRAQAISIEGGAVAVIDCDTDDDCYWVPLQDLPFCDLFTLAAHARWSAQHGGLEGAA